MLATVNLVFSAIQIFNRRSIGYLWDKKGDLDPGQVSIINSIYNNKKKGSALGAAEQKITYKLSTKAAGKLGYGRLYGTKGSFETLEKECRGTICKEYYHDIDIVNCHPVLLLQFAKKRFDTELPEVEKYVDNREAYLKTVMIENSITRDEAKAAIISVLYGGSCNQKSYLYELSQEVRGFSKKLFQTEQYADLAKVCKSEDNIYGTFLSFVLQTEERHCMLAMKEYLEGQGWCVDVLCYDGVMVRKREGHVPNLVGCESAILDKTEYAINLVTKEFSSFEMPSVTEEVVKGVTLDAYKEMKREFEKTNFYYGPANEMIEVRGKELMRMGIEHAREYYSRKWRFEHSQKFEDFTTFFDIWRKDKASRVITKIDMRENDNPEVFVMSPLFAWKEEGDANQIAEQTQFAAVEKFKEIMSLIGNPQQQDYIMKWLAQLVQQPFEKPGTSIIITGEKRTGKDTPFDFFGKYVMGNDYSRNYTCGGNQFFEKHDTGRMNMFLCKVEEADRRVFLQNSSKFKTLITAEDEMYNDKGKKAVVVANYNRFVLTLNPGAPPVELSDGEQRFLIATISDAKKHNIPYWTEVRKILFNKEAGRAVGKWLSTLDISDFDFRTVPLDEFQDTLVESERTSEEIFVEQWNGAMVKATTFFILYQNYCLDNCLPHCKNIKSLGLALLKLIRNGKLLKKKTNEGFVYCKPGGQIPPENLEM